MPSPPEDGWKWLGLVPLFLAIAAAVHKVVSWLAEKHATLLGFVHKVHETRAMLDSHLVDTAAPVERMHTMASRVEQLAIEQKALDEKVDFLELQRSRDKEEIIDRLHLMHEDIRGLYTRKPDV